VKRAYCDADLILSSRRTASSIPVQLFLLMFAGASPRKLKETDLHTAAAWTPRTGHRPESFGDTPSGCRLPDREWGPGDVESRYRGLSQRIKFVNLFVDE